MKKRPTSDDSKRLSGLIEDERRKLGRINFDDLSSPDAVARLGKLERLINEYMAIAEAGR